MHGLGLADEQDGSPGWICTFFLVGKNIEFLRTKHQFHKAFRRISCNFVCEVK
jgi:hypothetical protein